jgi:phytoene desaturase
MMEPAQERPAQERPAQERPAQERKAMVERSAAVIGAGFGGLALAIRLQSAGVRTTLIEARDRPGGRAGRFEDRGFHFDAGPTVITDPGCIEELFLLSGRRLADYVELLPVHPFYRLWWEDGSSFDYGNDEAELTRQIRERNPADVDGYRRFLDYSAGVFAEGYEALGHVAFVDFRTMLAAAPRLARYRAWRSVYDVVARYVSDPQLREAFSAEHALQCGYCTPGMLVTARDIVQRLPSPSEDEIGKALQGNICRCTGYHNIVRAVEQAAGQA